MTYSTTPHDRTTEQWIYRGIWLLAIGIYLLNAVRHRALSSAPLWDAGILVNAIVKLLPFIILFMVNNRLLIPRLLFRGRVWQYFLFYCCPIKLNDRKISWLEH